MASEFDQSQTNLDRDLEKARAGNMNRNDLITLKTNLKNAGRIDEVIEVFEMICST